MKRFFTVFISLLLCVTITGCSNAVNKTEASFFTKKYESLHASDIGYASEYKTEGISNSLEFLYQDICFSSEDVIPSGFRYDFTAVSAACYDVDNAEIIYSNNIFEKVYPASTTKLLTAYVAIRYSNPEDIVTIHEDNCGITLSGAQLCNFKAGDNITMKDLLYCLLLYSANDAGVAIAEHISGTTEAFCKLMNEEAASIGATDTHFTNPHGLHDLNHYTTAYDIYLIFVECLKYPLLKDIFKSMGYTAQITSSSGEIRELEVIPTNQYAKGLSVAPEGITVYGGKTGETIAAKNCLILYSEDSQGHGYITELFKSEDRPTVYKEMNILLKMCLDYSQN